MLIDNVDSSVESGHTVSNVTAALANTELFLWFWLPWQQKDVRSGWLGGGGKSKEQKTNKG